MGELIKMGGTPEGDYERARNWILDNMYPDEIDYTKTEFENDVKKHIESYDNFSSEWKDKIWGSVKDARDVEATIEEHKEEKGFIKRMLDKLAKDNKEAFGDAAPDCCKLHKN